MAADRFHITCAHCNRPLTLTLQLLQKRRDCTYCGQRLVIPPDIEKLLHDSPAGKSGLRPAEAFSVDCPVCARVSRMKSPPGSPAKCMFCGCPFVMPDHDGPVAPTPAAGSVPRVMVGESLAALSYSARCPACHATELLACDPLGLHAQCAACNAAIDCAQRPLEEFADLAAGVERQPLVLLAREALRARWKKRDAGLPEVRQFFDWLDMLDTWRGNVLSPFDVDFTTDVVQWAVLCEPDARVVREGHTMMLEVNINTDLDIELNVENVLEGTAAEIREAGLRVRRALTQGLRGRHILKRAVRRQDKILARFQFSPAKRGTAMDVDVVHTAPPDPEREPEEAEKQAAADGDLIEELDKRVLDQFDAAVHQYLAFRAIFGIWATPSIFNAGTEKGVQRRLESLGGTCAANAAGSARLLTQR